MRIWLASVFSLVLCLPAHATDRLFDMVAFNGRSANFIDTQTKQMNGQVASFWVLAVNPPMDLIKGVPTIHYMMAKMNINCAEKTAQTVESVFYGKDDDLLGSSTSPAAVISVVPNTFFDNEYKYVCLGQRFNPKFIMIPHVKDAVNYADALTKPPADAPTPND